MIIKSISIKNFKALSDVKLDLHETMNVIVGSNGSGKSSVLQAIHWMSHSARHPNVQPRSDELTSTLSERDAVYMPSPEYRSAGHKGEYGNTKGTPQLDLTIEAVMDESTTIAKMWLKAARNEGISVHVPASNPIIARIRDPQKEFSAYIPGVAGIPLAEERRPKIAVHRLAAAGDANTVLRNILVLLKASSVDGKNSLDIVQAYVSDVMGTFELNVSFDEERHIYIPATFRTSQKGLQMSGHKPLELAGIGYLQVLQIFSYLVYFQPQVLLVDEPDAHLYLSAQERLVNVLKRAASDFESQVLMTTHSPSIVRALPSDSKVIWMKDGRVQSKGNSEGRSKMGWGLLDRKAVVLTEDSNTQMLRHILAQWPALERTTVIWPLHGSGQIPSAESMSGFRSLLGDGMKLVIHRDRDFMMPDEVTLFEKKYRDKGVQVFVTQYSDLEAYWLDPLTIASHFSIEQSAAQALLDKCIEIEVSQSKYLEGVRQKRLDTMNKLKSPSGLPHYGDDEVLSEACKDGSQYGVLGKLLVKRIRSLSHNDGLPSSSSFGITIPPGLPDMAPELKQILEA